MDSIIQWNCRGIKPNRDELTILLTQHNPIAVCLQETFLKTDDNFSFKSHAIYSKCSDNAERASGGVSILVNASTPHSLVNLSTNLQAVAVSVTMHKTITLCSVYIPPSAVLLKSELDDLVSQLPSPFILLGDFNGHNILWGCKDTNKKGELIEDFLSDHNLSIFNDKSSTYLHPATGSYSSLDLTLCHPSLYLDFTWKVGDDLCGSDHFPIFLQSNGPPSTDRVQRWKLHKADWDTFRDMCMIELDFDRFRDAEDPLEHYISLLHDIAEKTIPKTSAKPKRVNKPWFDEECKEAMTARKRSIRQINNQATPENLNAHRIFRAKARRTIKASKRRTWRSFVSKLNSRSKMKTTWDMIRKINGKGKHTSINHLNKAGHQVSSKADIANTLADTFSKNSSSNNYSEEFLKVKSEQEKTKLNFSSDNSEHYNAPFSMRELISALEKAHDTSAGPDDIHYQLLKHLPEHSLANLLEIFNTIWEQGVFPLHGGTLQSYLFPSRERIIPIHQVTVPSHLLAASVKPWNE